MIVTSDAAPPAGDGAATSSSPSVETFASSAEEALHESEQCYRTLFEHAPEAVVVLDVELGRFVDANSNALSLFGASLRQLLRLGVLDVSPPDQPDGRPSAEGAARHMRAAVDGQSPQFEWVHRSLDGRDLTCQVRLVRLPTKGRCLIRGSVTDVTESKRLQEEVRQWQKIDALGQVAAGVAHDFNNLLGMILASANMLRETIVDDVDASSDIETIREAALSGALLTRRLLAFARREPEQVERIDLNEVIAGIDRLLRGVLPASIEIVTQLADGGAPVMSSRSQLEQILLNLALNARDAMPDGGTLRLTTTVVDGTSGNFSLCPPAYDGANARRIHLRVQDTGVGMDRGTLQRAFEPFFTTKAPGEGTGLGLATVFGIVKHAHGTIKARSLPGAGTTFEICLPEARPES